MFYATTYGTFQSSQPHALHDLGTHIEGCIYAWCNKAPVFYSPSEDTIICHADSSRTAWLYSSGNGLLCPELLCCKERRRLFAELRHIGVLAGRYLYGPSDSVTYRNDALIKL
ncbi:hypothetical protein BHYA_0091g00350 [Botrytis hyacinthi]|uniref:Uncharacterized protein n=1 Tax=Botrytis hyacinthi TaxID=278943 RepID=A0A4Z1GSF8_9HELO|nr:hypothetical protein BHYA_0091g00350 [Botrytis hyacinthi]